MEDTDFLRSQVAALRNEIENLKIRPERIGGTSSSPSSSSQTPFWDCTYTRGLTLTTGGGFDWDTQFDDEASSDRVRFHVATAHGFLDIVDYGHDNQRRHKISWDAANPSTVKASLMGGVISGADIGTVQVKMNGVITESALDWTNPPNGIAYYSLNVLAGRNQLVITADELPDNLVFAGILWDETRGDSWFDPRTLSGYTTS